MVLELTNIIMIMLVVFGVVIGMLISIFFGITFFSYQLKKIQREAKREVDFFGVKQRVIMDKITLPEKSMLVKEEMKDEQPTVQS